MAFEVAEVVRICRRRGFVAPTVYQGRYNLLDRGAEAEYVAPSLRRVDAMTADHRYMTRLFPCLRKFGIKFAAYSVLA